ncbi:MAG: GTP-binding protein [Candidatus Lokiarchaeota archaeon]|nr:GTP-binding protein [Candidatus Lokiarchaeota archaeon]
MKFFNAKVLLLGDGAVGKTSLIKQYIKGEFKGDYKPTIGVDVYSKEVKYQDVQLNLGVWDIAGQKQFEMFRKNFFKGAQAALLVFDYMRPDTFESLDKEWIKDLLELSGTVPFVLIGNKIDLGKQVDQNKINSLVSKYDVDFIETSALNNTNVEDAFLNIAAAILQNYIT